jgi:hypothetical protein
METVKVDMQRLQLLNDRIVQTIEVLNQLRLTVHGIQHSPSPVGAWGGYQAMYGQPTYGQPTFAQPTFGQPTFGQPTFAQPTFMPSPYGFGGLSHSTFEPQWQNTQWQTPQWQAPHWQTRTTMQPAPWMPTYPVSIY